MTISGTLTGASAGTTVNLWQKLPWQTSYHNVAQTTTNAAGDYTIVRRPGVVKTNASWYTTASSATSAVWLQTVKAKVRLLTWAVAGTRVKLKGLVAPAHPGERISLQRYSRTKGWHTIASAMTGRLSRFTVRHRFANGGNVRLRVVFGGDARNAQAASAPLRLRLV